MYDLKPACGEVAALLHRIPAGRLGAPTPCTDFTVAALVRHLDEAAKGFAALAARQEAEPLLAAGPDGELPAGWRQETAEGLAALAAAWDAPEAWTGSTAAGPELPNEVWGLIALTEVVVHGWDLARATGLSVGFPEPTLRACLAHVTDFVPKAPLPELWGTPVDVPAEAPLLDRVVAGTGRDPGAASRTGG